MKSARLMFTVIVTLLLFMSVPGMYMPLKKHAPFLPDYGPLEKEISAYLEEHPGTYGLYFIDLNSGRQFGHNAQTTFHAASTFKLPLNLYLYREAAEGRLELNEELLYAERHLEGGTGILKEQKPGSRYTVAQLSELSVIQSDNVAANMLLERLGRREIKEFMRSLGAKVVDDNANITCPFDLSIYMYAMLDFSRSYNTNSTMLLNHLFNSRYKDRIPAPLPDGIRVANKIGTWPPEHTYNDAAYVVHPRRPYILVLTSRDTPGYGDTMSVMHHLSKLVYDYQTGVVDRE